MALKFDGVDDYLESITDICGTKDNRALMIWSYHTSSELDTGTWFLCGFGCQLYTSGQEEGMGFFRQQTTSVNPYHSEDKYQDNIGRIRTYDVEDQWNCWIIVQQNNDVEGNNDGVVRSYHQGVLEDTKADGLSYVSARARPLFIARRPGPSSGDFVDWYLARCAYWEWDDDTDLVFTGDHAAALYDGAPPTAILPEYLVGWWEMYDDATAGRDMLGRNNLTVNSAPATSSIIFPHSTHLATPYVVKPPAAAAGGLDIPIAAYHYNHNVGSRL